MSDFMGLPGQSGIRMNGDVGIVSFGGDERLWVRFHKMSVPTGAAAVARGEPAFRSIDMVDIQQPGERDRLSYEVTEVHKARFPRQWQQYVEGQEQMPDGTPLTVLFPANPEIADIMRPFKIYTVEQLAGLTDEGIQRVGAGARAWAARAKDYTDRMAQAKPFVGMQAAIDKLNAQLAAQNEAIEALKTRNAALEAAAKPARQKES